MQNKEFGIWIGTHPSCPPLYENLGHSEEDSYILLGHTESMFLFFCFIFNLAIPTSLSHMEADLKWFSWIIQTRAEQDFSSKANVSKFPLFHGGGCWVSKCTSCAHRRSSKHLSKWPQFPHNSYLFVCLFVFLLCFLASHYWQTLIWI